jgi:hypothetical protein
MRLSIATPDAACDAHSDGLLRIIHITLRRPNDPEVRVLERVLLGPESRAARSVAMCAAQTIAIGNSNGT